MSKKILITGAGGYIGSRMVERFIGMGFKVIALDRFFFGDVLEDLSSNKNLKIVREDIRLFDRKILKGVYAVIDLASISNDASGSLNPTLTREINYKGSVRVAKLSKEVGVKRYIFASSCSVYGSGDGILNEDSLTGPLTEYAHSKLSAEKKMLKMSNDEFLVSVLRNATVYGLSKRRMRFDLMVNLMTLSSWRDNKIIIWGGGKQWRPLVHVDDCIDAFLRIIEEKDEGKISGQIYNVGSNNQNFQVIEVAEYFRSFFPKLKIERVKDAPEKRNYKVDFTKISKNLHFVPKRTIKIGIEEIRKALDKKEIEHDLRTHTLNYYSYLMEAENILKKMRLKGKLF